MTVATHLCSLWDSVVRLTLDLSAPQIYTTMQPSKCGPATMQWLSLQERMNNAQRRFEHRRHLAVPHVHCRHLDTPCPQTGKKPSKYQSRSSVTIFPKAESKPSCYSRYQEKNSSIMKRPSTQCLRHHSRGAIYHCGFQASTRYQKPKKHKLIPDLSKQTCH